MRKIAFAELHQETNSFSPVLSTMREFKGFALHYGTDIEAFATKFKAQALGFLQTLKREGCGQFEALPLFAAWSFSGGPVEKNVYDHFRQKLWDGLSQNPSIEALYLSLHGAMAVEGLRDPESDLLQLVRDLRGHDFPVGVTYDMHANVTRKNAELATFINGYHTNPHRDHRRVGAKATRMLLQTLRGEARPVMAMNKMKLIKGGGWGIDFLPPMRGIFRRMRQMERIKGVMSASNFWVHLWLDDPELGWSTVVVTNGDEKLAQELADELAELNWQVRDRPHPEPKTVEQAISIARSARLRRMLGTVVFCDVSDTVGAGAPGENTHILRGLLQQAPELISYVPVRDAVSAVQAFEAGVGRQVSLSVGGKLLPHLHPATEYEGEVILARETNWGRTAIVKHKGIHLLLTELAFPGYFAEDYFGLGLNLWKADITVVKNLFPFRYRFLRYNRKTVNVGTQGITSLDVHQLPYTSISRPVFPLDALSDWK